MQTEEYDWITDGELGWVFSGFNAAPKTMRGLQIEHITTRDGDTFTSESIFGTDRSASNFSYGLPIETRSHSNISTDPRGTNTTYEHNTNAWILGQTKKVYEVATTGARREMSSYNYNNKGQLTSRTRYGQLQATYGYHADGNIDWVKDALNRETQASNWYRGKPQLVTKAVGTPDEITTEQTLNANGWVTSQTDAMGRTTSYTHDDMGRVTKVNPPGSWDDTDITYSFPNSGGAVQTTTKGQAKTTVTYDSLLRPILERTQALDTGWSSYVNTTYDALGRVIFKSQPSSNEFETKGVDTTYDGLGRVYDIRENVAPYATTKHRYFSCLLYTSDAADE